MTHRRYEDTVICLSANGRTQSASSAAPHKLLVATTDAVCRFERTSAKPDWALVRDDMLAGHHVSALAFEPRSGLLFAGLHYQGGLLVSADEGETWEERNEGLESGHVYTLHVQQRKEGTILYAGTEPAMLYRSENLGRSWTALPSMRDVPDTDKWLFPRSVPHIKNIASHPSQPDTLYICVEQGDLLKSVDAGRTWRQLTSVDRPDDKFRRDMHRVALRAEDPEEIFLTTGVGLFHSTDGGDSWEQLTNATSPICYPDPFFIHPDDRSLMFLVGAGISPGPQWAAMGTANPSIMRSHDNGRTWEEAMAGIRRPVRGNIEAAAMHSSGEAGVELFVGTACGELYTSSDNADRWQLLADKLAAISKGPHFRHFLSPEEREAVENKLREMHAFV